MGLWNGRGRPAKVGIVNVTGHRGTRSKTAQTPQESDVSGFRWLAGAAAFLLALDALVDLFAMHGHRARGVDAETHLVALDAEHRDRDFVTDHECFAHAPGKDQHDLLLE